MKIYRGLWLEFYFSYRIGKIIFDWLIVFGAHVHIWRGGCKDGILFQLSLKQEI